jgi:hypothetical protein
LSDEVRTIGPARFTVQIDPKKDKYGPGVSFFFGYDSAAEGFGDLGSIFSTQAVEAMIEMAERQVLVDHARLLGAATDEAIQALREGGALPNSAGQDTKPEQGRNNDDERELGADINTGRTIKVRNGKYGWYVTDGEDNQTIAKFDKPETLTVERASKLLQDRRAYVAKNK